MFKFKRLPLFSAIATAYLLASLAAFDRASATPQFARQTKLPCSACHSHVPLLNPFGQRFYANGFRMPGQEHAAKGGGNDKGEAPKAEWTVPLWTDIEAVGETSKSLGNSRPIQWDCTLVASFGYIDALGLLYHAEWLPVDNNTFIYAVKPIGDHFSISAGQLELISQYDPLLDVSPTEPVILSPNGSGYTGIPGIYGPFSPGGTAYAARVVWSPFSGNAMPYSDGWKIAGTVPYANEVAYGLAQPKWQNSPTGTFLETYYRAGMSSYGLNSFLGSDGRHYYGVVLQQKAGPLFFEGGAAYDQYGLGHTNLVSASVEWPIAWNGALAFRVDDEDGYVKYTPSASFLVGGRRSAFRLVVEGSFTRSGQPLTTVTADVKF